MTTDDDDQSNAPIDRFSQQPARDRWVEPTVDGVFTPAKPLANPATAIDDVQFDTQMAPADALEIRSESLTSVATAEPPELASEPSSQEPSSGLRTMVEWVAVVVAALAIALFIKAFLVQAFEIPSGSMETTLNIGDRILVNKLSYVGGDVERGNLVVFGKLEGTQSDTNELIKRFVALPGETIEVRDDGLLYIYTDEAFNAIQLDQSFLDPQNSLLPVPSAAMSPDQNIWHENCTNAEGDGSRCTLDDSSYFGMGDNRAASTDSRSFGPIPEENVVGRAFARIWPLSAISGL